VVQRVSKAEVHVEGTCTGSIGAGLVVLLAVGREDTEQDADFLARKTLDLRVFEDPEQKMNLSVRDIGGALIVVSQFTLYGDCRKGNRPSFASAAPPDLANRLYERFVQAVAASGLTVRTGCFQTRMGISLTNDGPVTILLDSRKTF